jgi:NAD(P)-dependent dehydrogenase (short-subunit alcohol dehydrogenase family)
MMRLVNRVAIITGGSRGIGQAIALAFARESAKVVVVSRTQARNEEVAKRILANAGEAIAVEADVSKEKDVARIVAQTLAKFHRVDILVNNAGVNLPYRTVVDLPLQDWNWVLGINLTGPFLCSKAVLPKMIGQRSGKIINLASSGGRHGAAGRTPYRPTKAAIINFTECLAAEVKQFGIDVNAICPEMTDTDMLREVTHGEVPPNASSPEDIADLAVFLASEESAAVTGSAIDAYGTANPLFAPPPVFRPPSKS